jgi:hypothetical protein
MHKQNTTTNKNEADMHEFVHGIGYLDTLKQRREEILRHRESMPKSPTLHEKIRLWVDSLSPEEQSRAWTMKEFRIPFHDTPQKIGAALFDLGWTRRRMWRDDRPTARYWLKM